MQSQETLRAPGGEETSDVGTARSYEFYRVALEEASYPCAFVDMDRIDANISSIRSRANGVPVRVASKSVRCLAVLEYVLQQDGFEGIMCYSGQEAEYLAKAGFDDLLLAYPIWGEADIDGVAGAIEAGATVQVMVDSPAHVKRLATGASDRDVTIPLCLDIDLSTEHVGIHFGVRRSGIQTPETALEVCQAARDAENVTLKGVMGYESQLAGIPDRSPGNNRVMNGAIRLLKRRSRPIVKERRVEIVRAIERAGFELDLVNGGGTGCVEFTRTDPSVTEITVGSGLYAPALFDYYDAFQHFPAAGYAIEVTRTPASDIYTCRGGGYVSSGPPSADSEPKPWYPEGMSLRDEEGAGEVQTPVLYDGPIHLSLGDPVFFRHAKAGELAEQFEELQVIRNGDVVETVSTYRGDGRCFL